MEVWQTSNLRRLRLGEEKKEERKKKKETTGQKYNGLPYSQVRSPPMTSGLETEWDYSGRIKGRDG